MNTAVAWDSSCGEQSCVGPIEAAVTGRCGPVGWFECRLANDRRGNVVPIVVAGWCWFNGGKRKEGREATVVVASLLFCIELCVYCFMSAVTYSPTTSRLQYHQRGQA